MVNQRFKNNNWVFRTTPTGSIESWEQVQCALLMDIRDELQRLNTLVHCQDAIDIPQILRRIEKNTTKKPRRLARVLKTGATSSGGR